MIKYYFIFGKKNNTHELKLVDTKDLKSLLIGECQFESGREHQKII